MRTAGEAGGGRWRGEPRAWRVVLLWPRGLPMGFPVYSLSACGAPSITVPFPCGQCSCSQASLLRAHRLPCDSHCSPFQPQSPSCSVGMPRAAPPGRLPCSLTAEVLLLIFRARADCFRLRDKSEGPQPLGPQCGPEGPSPLGDAQCLPCSPHPHSQPFPLPRAHMPRAH